MPPVQVRQVRVTRDTTMQSGTLLPDDGLADDRVLEVTYRVPGVHDNVKPGQGEPHVHSIPYSALIIRMGMYGLTAEEAVEECMLEVLASFAGDRDPDKWLSRAEQARARGRTPVTGLGPALRQAGVTLPEPSDETLAHAFGKGLRIFGRERVAEMRGQRPDELPDPSDWHPGKGPLVRPSEVRGTGARGRRGLAAPDTSRANDPAVPAGTIPTNP